MKYLLPTIVAALLILFVFFQSSAEPTSQTVYELKLPSEVEWTALNPARGEKGPRAANLWGNRSGFTPTGFLVKFVEGFASPPHIHNVTYRGVVISGLVHNDDPAAADMWMPTGSFWTQPAGEVHITSAKAKENIAYIEIDAGPYLVLPAEEASDNGERPINIHRSNVVWLDASDTNRIQQAEGKPSPEIAFLWEASDDRKNETGTFVKLPAGFEGKIGSPGGIFRGIVIEGEPEYRNPRSSNSSKLAPGTYFGSKGKAVHSIINHPETECILYIRGTGSFAIDTE